MWFFHEIWADSGIYWLFSNAYVWISLVLLIGLPIAVPRTPGREPDQPTADATGDFDRAVAGLLRSRAGPGCECGEVLGPCPVARGECQAGGLVCAHHERDRRHSH